MLWRGFCLKVVVIIFCDVQHQRGLVCLVCLESNWPDCQTLHSMEQRRKGDFWFQSAVWDEAEGRDREQVDEEAIGGKRLTDTPNRDMTQR